MKKFIKIFAAVVIAVTCLTSCTFVDTSEVGIKFKKFSLTEQGKLEAEIVTGYIFYNPFTEGIYTYPVYVQTVDYDPFIVTTKDAAAFKMDPYIAYMLDRNKSVDVFAKYRKSLKTIEQGYMRTVIYDAYRITANQYASDELMGNRAKFEEEVRIMLNKSLTDEGFILNEFTSQITPPESLSKIINDKNAAVQSALKAENEVKKAEADAKIAIAQAEGKAKALRIKADAEAYYNRVVAASLNELLVRQDAIKKWDGKLPTYNGGAMPFLNIGK